MIKVHIQVVFLFFIAEFSAMKKKRNTVWENSARFLLIKGNLCILTELAHGWFVSRGSAVTFKALSILRTAAFVQAGGEDA